LLLIIIDDSFLSQCTPDIYISGHDFHCKKILILQLEENVLTCTPQEYATLLIEISLNELPLSELPLSELPLNSKQPLDNTLLQSLNGELCTRDSLFHVKSILIIK
jgi:hypothetical protein